MPKKYTSIGTTKEYTSIGTIRVGSKAKGPTVVFFVPDRDYSVKRGDGTYAVFVKSVESEKGSSPCLNAQLVKCDPKMGSCVDVHLPCSALCAAVLEAAIDQKKVEIYIEKIHSWKSESGTSKWSLTGITIPAPTSDK